MARCAYCGKDLDESRATFSGDAVFCNDMCRYSFETMGGPKKKTASLEPGIPAKRKKHSQIVASIVSGVAAAVAAGVVGALFSADFTPLKPFDSPDGTFKALLPGKVTEHSETVNTPVGPIVYKAYAAKAKHHEFSIGCSDYPPGVVENSDPRAMLDGARDGAVRNVEGRLLSETIIEMQGCPGRVLRVEVGAGHIVVQKVVLAGSRMYQVIAVCSKGHSLDRKVSDVLDSFRMQSSPCVQPDAGQ